MWSMSELRNKIVWGTIFSQQYYCQWICFPNICHDFQHLALGKVCSKFCELSHACGVMKLEITDLYAHIK